MDRTKLILISLGVIGILLIAYIMSGNNTKKKKTTTASDTELYREAIETLKSNDGGYSKDVVQNSASLFDDGNLLTYDEIIDRASKGKIDLVSELWTLRGKCGTEMTIAKCNAMINVFLDSNYPPPGNKHLSEIFGKYLEYEEFMRSTEISSKLSDKEKFEQIQKYRRKFFSEKDAKLIFGYEEAKNEYVSNLGTFLQNSKDEKFESRIKNYEKMRKESLGPYYDHVVSLESPFDKYQTELNLKSADLSKLSDKQSKEEIKELRIKYFGKEGNARLEKVDEEIRQRDQKIAEYKAEEEKYLKEISSLPEADKKKKLFEFREKKLGKEEAESYTRIENIETYQE